MSSFSLDVSGKRGLSCTLNDDSRTAVTIPSREGDDATISINSFAEITAYLPATAKLQLVRIPHEKDDGYDEMIRLVIPDASAKFTCKAGEKSYGGHVGVSARKDGAHDFFLEQRAGVIANEVPLAAAVLVQVETLMADVPRVERPTER